MQLHSFTFNPFQENTYILWDENTKHCAIVDPGNYTNQENEMLKMFILENELIPTHLIGTHAHIDHVFGNWFVKSNWNIPYYLHAEDHSMLERSLQMAALWNLNYTPGPPPDHGLQHGEILKIGDSELEVRFVPGHAPGHVIFINHAGRWVVCGDTLFRDSIGRTDLPGGNHELLLLKIREQMFSLPEDYMVHSGHGPETSIGYEKQNNPFLV